MTANEKLQKKIDAYCKWHKWFAWYPVTLLDNGITYRVWLEEVGRKKKVYMASGDMCNRYPAVGYPVYCFIEQVVIKAITDPDIINECDT